MDTYTYHGHSMSDPGSTYQTRDDISGGRQVRDPIETVRKLLLAHIITTEKELKGIEKEVRKEVEEAIVKAKNTWLVQLSSRWCWIVEGVIHRKRRKHDDVRGKRRKHDDVRAEVLVLFT